MGLGLLGLGYAMDLGDLGLGFGVGHWTFEGVKTWWIGCKFHVEMGLRGARDGFNDVQRFAVKREKNTLKHTYSSLSRMVIKKTCHA